MSSWKSGSTKTPLRWSSHGLSWTQATQCLSSSEGPSSTSTESLTNRILKRGLCMRGSMTTCLSTPPTLTSKTPGALLSPGSRAKARRNINMCRSTTWDRLRTQTTFPQRRKKKSTRLSFNRRIKLDSTRGQALLSLTSSRRRRLETTSGERNNKKRVTPQSLITRTTTKWKTLRESIHKLIRDLLNSLLISLLLLKGDRQVERNRDILRESRYISRGKDEGRQMDQDMGRKIQTGRRITPQGRGSNRRDRGGSSTKSI